MFFFVFLLIRICGDIDSMPGFYYNFAEIVIPSNLFWMGTHVQKNSFFCKTEWLLEKIVFKIGTDIFCVVEGIEDIIG